MFLGRRMNAPQAVPQAILGKRNDRDVQVMKGTGKQFLLQIFLSCGSSCSSGRGDGGCWWLLVSCLVLGSRSLAGGWLLTGDLWLSVGSYNCQLSVLSVSRLLVVRFLAVALGLFLLVYISLDAMPASILHTAPCTRRIAAADYFTLRMAPSPLV